MLVRLHDGSTQWALHCCTFAAPATRDVAARRAGADRRVSAAARHLGRPSCWRRLARCRRPYRPRQGGVDASCSSHAYAIASRVAALAGAAALLVAKSQPASTASFNVSYAARAAAPFTCPAALRSERTCCRTAVILSVLHHALSASPARAAEKAKISAKARRTTGFRMGAGERGSSRNDCGTRDGTAPALYQR